MSNIIATIAEEAQKRGFEVKIRDIAYALLKVKLKDDNIAYTVSFGSPLRANDVENYDSLESVQFLVKWFEKDLNPPVDDKAEIINIIKNSKGSKKNTKEDNGISFEENRAGIEKQINEILELKKNCPEDDIKTMALLQKTEADLRSKLNDKFGASEKDDERYVVVHPRFNHICEHTHRECWLQTKEFAMEHWNLTEKT